MDHHRAAGDDEQVGGGPEYDLDDITLNAFTKFHHAEFAMDTTEAKRLKAVWRQAETPVILRKGKGYPLMVRLSCSEESRAWLRSDRSRIPKWNSKYNCWEVPKRWFNKLVGALLDEHKTLYIIQPHREQEKCAPACWHAVGHECECSCMGEHHGTQNPDGAWFVVSEAFATRWDEQQLACRLLKKK